MGACTGSNPADWLQNRPWNWIFSLGPSPHPLAFVSHLLLPSKRTLPFLSCVSPDVNPERFLLLILVVNTCICCTCMDIYSSRFVYKIVPIFYLVVNDDSLFLFLWRCLAGILVLLGGQIEKEGRRERDVSWCFVACFWRLWGLLVDLNTGTFWLFFLYFLLKMLERDIFGFWIVRR